MFSGGNTSVSLICSTYLILTCNDTVQCIDTDKFYCTLTFRFLIGYNLIIDMLGAQSG